MTQAVIWWMLAAALVIAELLTGTFYLLMLACAAIAGSAAAVAGAALTFQLLIAAACALIALAVLRWARKRRSHQRAILNFDIGAHVYIEAWDGRVARAMYRGAQWDAEFAGIQEPADQSWYEIQAVRGNCLIVAPLKPAHDPTARL